VGAASTSDRHRTRALLGSFAFEWNEATMYIDKTEIMAWLLSRGSEDRAAWVDRVLPQLVDTDANASLLRLLEVDLTTMSPVEQRQS
jgi:hypothetical protein